MISLRTPLASFLVPALTAAAIFAGSSLCPTLAQAEVSGHVASIAAKGTIPPIVPVASGLGCGLAAALLAFGLDRRARSRR